MEPLGQRVKTYCFWGTVSGVVFFTVYPTCNWLTSLRSHHYEVFLKSELAIPFWPAWIWVYVSMYALFMAPPFFMECSQLRLLGKQLVWTTLAAGASFLLVPATLGFARVAPAEGYLHEVYQGIFQVDKPHNLIPSLHVIWSTAIAMSLADNATLPWRVLFLGWAVAIALSTLFVHQHHLIDLVVAFIFVMIARKYMGERKP
jgi:membrane-associated phospholipid phosphatase